MLQSRPAHAQATSQTPPASSAAQTSNEPVEQPPSGEPRGVRPRDLSFSYRSDGIATGTLLAANLLLEFAWPVPTAPRWEHVSTFDLRAAERWGIASPFRATRASDGLLGISMLATPLVSFFGPLLLSRNSAGAKRSFEDSVIVLEAALSTAIVTQSVKKLAARTRPAVYFDSAEMTEYSSLLQLRDRQRYVSFFSGHASTAASLAAALITVGYLRRYPYRHVLAVAFSALALATGWLRVVGRIHWTSDVLAGWGVGTLIGVGVPLVREKFARQRGEEPANGPLLSPMASASAGLSATWIF